MVKIGVTKQRRSGSLTGIDTLPLDSTHKLHVVNAISLDSIYDPVEERLFFSMPLQLSVSQQATSSARMVTNIPLVAKAHYPRPLSRAQASPS